MKKLFGLCLVLSVCFLQTTASNAQYWAKTYGGIEHDEIFSIEETTDGGYVVAGETYSFDVANSDAWIIKLDSNGTVTWQKTYGESEWERAFSIQETIDGGYIVAGGTFSFVAVSVIHGL